jgi:hypothetical protein
MGGNLFGPDLAARAYHEPHSNVLDLCEPDGGGYEWLHVLKDELGGGDADEDISRFEEYREEADKGEALTEVYGMRDEDDVVGGENREAWRRLEKWYEGWEVKVAEKRKKKKGKKKVRMMSA